MEEWLTDALHSGYANTFGWLVIFHALILYMMSRSADKDGAARQMMQAIALTMALVGAVAVLKGHSRAEPRVVQAMTACERDAMRAAGVTAERPMVAEVRAAKARCRSMENKAREAGKELERDTREAERAQEELERARENAEAADGARNSDQ